MTASRVYSLSVMRSLVKFALRKNNRQTDQDSYSQRIDFNNLSYRNLSSFPDGSI